MAKICKYPQKLGAMANSLNYDLKETIDGRFRVLQKGTRAFLMTGTEAEVRGVLTKIGRGDLPDLLGHIPAPLESTPLTIKNLRPQDQVQVFPTKGNFEKVSQWGREGGLKHSTGTFAVITPMRGLMQAIEKSGTGKAFSKIWTPTQDARNLVSQSLATIKRATLGNKTYQDTLHALNGRVTALSPEQRTLVALRKEAFTKDELVRPGVLLKKGMSQAEIGFADDFARLGVAEDIPVLLRVSATVDELVKNRENAITVMIPQLIRDITDGKLPQEMIPVLKSIQDAAANVGATADDVIKQLSLPDNEIEAIKKLRVLVDNKSLNVPAIYRHATAPIREARFKTGREQFESVRGMSKEASLVADEYDKIYETAFANHTQGVSSSQVLGAQLPIFRQFIDAGLFPGRYTGEGATSAVNKYTRVLEDLTEGTDILTRRVLSGHINPYELNPSVQASKHVRNLVLREQFDPVVYSEGVQSEILNVKNQDPRLGKFMQNYVDELEGIPNDNFKWLNDAIRTTARLMGKTIDDQFAERMLNQLNFITSAATIPFRAGLILRNFYQTTLVPAIVGPEAWVHGMKVATGFGEGGYSLDNMRKAMLQATKDGALKPDVLPIHAGSEAIEQTAQFFGTLGPGLAKAGLNTKELFDLGFTLYRSADDWGRTVAYFAGRHRVSQHLEAFMRSNQSDAALEIFKRNAKVKMFDETIEAQFDALAKANEWEGMKKLIGKTLADDTHFLYGDASHPVGWNSVAGKLFGQFGTFPVQYLSYLGRGLSRGTFKDKAEFAFIHSATNLGIVAAGAEFADVDLTSWAFTPSLTYTGGPYADIALNLYQLHGGSDAEKSIAKYNLTMMFPTWDHPNSVFVPGSFAINDIVQAFNEGSYARALGFRQATKP